VPQPAVARHEPVLDLADQHRLHPAGLAGVLARHHLVERARRPGQRPQAGHEADQYGVGEPGADVAEIAQRACGVVRTEQ
jgi:hypothetical protein